MRILVAVALACLAGVNPANADPVSAGLKHTIDVPPQALAPALRSYATETGLHLIYISEDVRARRSDGARGSLTAAEALSRILRGTGLTYHFLDADTISIVPLAHRGAAAAAAGGRSGGAAAADPARKSNAGKSPKESRTQLRGEAIELQPVLVTATRRPEEARAIAGSVTAFTGDELDALGAQGFSDYLTRAPGVAFNYSIPGDSTIVIRGVSTTTFPDQGEGTTAYFINDVPLTDPFHSVAIPDIDTFDVANVTIMRGPQGTLFGSASMGGALNYEAAKPNLDEYQAHVQGTMDGVDSGGLGGSGKLMLNAPIVPGLLAVRGVFVYRSDPGFIDNLGTHQENVNRTLNRGGRFEATWTPSDSSTVNYLFLKQSEDTRDLGYSEPGYAGLYAKNTAVPEPFAFGVTINSLRLDQSLSAGTLTVMASYHQKTQLETGDFTSSFSFLAPGASAIVYQQTAQANGTTLEARFASPTGRKLEYVVGAFHDLTHENFNAVIGTQGLPAAELSNEIDGVLGVGSGAAIVEGNGLIENDLAPFSGSESAIYGQASYRPVSDWKLTFGGRYYYTTTRSESLLQGLSPYLDTGGVAAVQSYSGGESDSGFLPKGSVTWTPNGKVMLYGLVSTGFRYGGANINSSPTTVNVPHSYKPDSLTNYELGTRTNWLQKRLQLDATLFYIDWDNIQLQEYAGPGDLFGVNAGKARNYGAELTGTWQIDRDLSIQANVTRLTAKLANAFNPGGGLPVDPQGSTLPGAAEWQAASTLMYRAQELPLRPTLVLSQRYVSSSPGLFGSDTEQGNYDLLDARISLSIRNLLVTAYVDNIGNTRGVTNAVVNPPLELTLATPRMVGLTLDYEE
jgi:iron complex outermembrane recepter protein